MRSKDPHLLASVLMSDQAGGVLLPTKQFDGILDAVVLDTHASNPTACPVAGTCRIIIPALESTVPWGPVAYPGTGTPPNGTQCQVGFIAPVANGSVDAPVRVLCFEGFPTAIPDSGWTPVTAFANSWGNQATYTTSYRSLGNIVRIRGVIVGGLDATSAFTLPAGSRPPTVATFPCASNSATANTYLQISTAGVLTLYGVSGITAWMGLDQVSFTTD